MFIDRTARLYETTVKLCHSTGMELVVVIVDKDTDQSSIGAPADAASIDDGREIMRFDAMSDDFLKAAAHFAASDRLLEGINIALLKDDHDVCRSIVMCCRRLR